MKKLILSLSLVLIVGFSAFGFFACKKKSAEPEDQSANWVGTWKFSSVEVWSDESGKNTLLDTLTVDQIIQSPEEWPDVAAYVDTYLNLKADNTYSTNFVEAMCGLATSLDPVVLNDNVDEFEYNNLKWTVKNNRLFLDGYASWIVYDAGKVNKEAESVNSIFGACDYSSIELSEGKIKVNLTFNEIDESTQAPYKATYVVILEK